jgi:hypothetical protein
VDVVFTTSIVFFAHHRLVTRPMLHTIIDADQASIEEDLVMLSEIGLAAAPKLETIKQRAFSGLRAKGFAEATAVALEAPYNGRWEGTATEPGMRVGAVPAWQEAAQRDPWSLASPFQREAAPVMLARHARNLDKDCVGISELENAPINTDFAESGFAHLDRATRTLYGAGMESCTGVAHARMPRAFQTAGGRREAAKAAVRKQLRATGSSFNGTALDQVDVDAKKTEFEITSFFKLPKAKRWEIIRRFQRRYRGDVVVASREALKAEAAARTARLRQ